MKTPALNDLLDASTLARVLNVTRPTIYRWTRADGLPAIRINRRCVRYEKNSVAKWLISRYATDQRPAS